MASEKIQTLTDTNFDETVIESTGPVLVDFWAEWCAPVPSLGPDGGRTRNGARRSGHGRQTERRREPCHGRTLQRPRDPDVAHLQERQGR